MKCTECGREIGKVKKNQLINCKCGAKLLAVEMNKNLHIYPVHVGIDMDKEEY